MKRYWVRLADEEVEVGVDESAGTLLVTVGGRTHRVEVSETVPSSYALVIDGTAHDLLVRDRAGPMTLSLDGVGYRADVAGFRRAATAGAPDATARAEDVRAPMPGLLIALQVGEGSSVEMGQAIAIMEAMKMQMEIRAPHAGTIRRVHVSPGQELAAGQLLVTMA